MSATVASVNIRVDVEPGTAKLDRGTEVTYVGWRVYGGEHASIGIVFTAYDANHFNNSWYLNHDAIPTWAPVPPAWFNEAIKELQP